MDLQDSQAMETVSQSLPPVTVQWTSSLAPALLAQQRVSKRDPLQLPSTTERQPAQVRRFTVQMPRPAAELE